jgi:DEP domain-containing protein 5
MANSREQSLFGRRRSNTGQSTFRPILPTSATTVSLKLGDSKVLNAWVHDVKDSPAVIFNQSWWPGVAEGDLLKVLSSNADHPDSAFLFMVPKDEGCPKPQLQVYFSFHKQYSGLILVQISVPRPIADVFSLRNNGEVTLTKVSIAFLFNQSIFSMLRRSIRPSAVPITSNSCFKISTLAETTCGD